MWSNIGNNRLMTSVEYADHQSVGSVWWQATSWNGTEIAYFGYDYYADGTLRSAQEGRGAGARQLAWDYYPDGSLMYEQDTLQGARPNFTYDAGGNMLMGIPAAPTTTAQYAYNQLRQIGNWVFGYNLNGERISEQNSPTGNREYGYDGFGNLVWVKQNGQVVYEAQYDALGRRVAYRTPATGGWVYLLYDGDALVAEIDPYGTVLAEYVWGQLGPVARVERSGLYGYRVLLYVCDALGHVRMLVDASTGQVTDRYAYDAWGNLIYHEGTTRQPFTWNGAYGYEWIPEVGLYHVGARAYDPRTARWLQRDPIDAASGDPNLYRYCGNDSVSRADPSGLKAIALFEDIDIFGWILNSLGGGSLGFGSGLLYALIFENRPSRTGQAKLGRPSNKWPYWERSFHLDGPHKGKPNPHFNAEYGPLSRFNHRDVPDWLYRLGNNRVLRNIGRGAVVLGLALDVLDIATAGPCDRGRAIGGAVGGAVGAAVGGAIGSVLAPGIGTWIGGTLGGLAGSALGQLIGSQFDPECDCPNRR